MGGEGVSLVISLHCGVSLTSSSRSFLKHRHAARFLKPSPSYVLVWFGLSFMLDFFFLNLNSASTFSPSVKTGKNKSERDGERERADERGWVAGVCGEGGGCPSNDLGEEPPHRYCCCSSLHPWSEMRWSLMGRVERGREGFTLGVTLRSLL